MQIFKYAYRTEAVDVKTRETDGKVGMVDK